MTPESITKKRMPTKHRAATACTSNESSANMDDCRLQQEPLLSAHHTLFESPLLPPSQALELVPATDANTTVAAIIPSSSSLTRPSMILPYEHLPIEILGLVESHLPPSDCAHLSATSTSLHHRWTARRWQRTFQLHYGRRSQLRTKERLVNLRKARKRLMKLRRMHNQQHLDFGRFSDKCTNEQMIMD
mmetsp:Transcript_13364/g.24569  ORF Transcript_13364/g.24569 Transcript_13364/m.24569 type:complete len:189 (-) Transcript_13364:208-774(-)